MVSPGAGRTLCAEERAATPTGQARQPAQPGPTQPRQTLAPKAPTSTSRLK